MQVQNTHLPQPVAQATIAQATIRRVIIITITEDFPHKLWTQRVVGAWLQGTGGRGWLPLQPLVSEGVHTCVQVEHDPLA